MFASSILVPLLVLLSDSRIGLDRLVLPVRLDLLVNLDLLVKLDLLVRLDL